MFRIFGVIVLLCAMYFTWNLFNGERDYPSEVVHTQIQTRLIEKLPELILEAHPMAYDINIKKCWTQALGEKEIKAYFEVSFKEKSIFDSTETTKTGYALLTNDDVIAGDQVWNAKEFKVEGQRLNFKKGLVL